MVASACGKIDFVRFLLMPRPVVGNISSEVEVLSVNSAFLNAIMMARKNGHLAIVELLEDSLSELDLELLGTMLYLLTNIKEQNIKDSSYIKFLNHCIKNSRLILDNFRINLKIKEYFNFINININLGILAKHLTINKDNVIELNNEDDTCDLTVQLKEITRKYIKYKAKYQNIKLTVSSEKNN